MLLLVAVYSSKGQDVEKTLREVSNRLENPLGVSGSLNIGVSAYQTSLPIDRAIPFNAQLSALLNLHIFGVRAPLSFLYSSGGTAFNVELPTFAFAGISPQYRDYTLHLGDRTLNLGKYSFSNHSFRGVGAEVDKKRWYGRAFVGRLQRAQSSDFSGFQNVNTLYKRLGYGALIGFRANATNFVEVSLFKGWDDSNSVGQVDSSLVLFPAQNVIGSIKASQKLGYIFHLDLNYSRSGLTERSDLIEDEGTSFFKSYGGLIETNNSTRWSNAFEVGLMVKVSASQIRFGYERIDPGYRTLGALFFQDDQENVTGGLTTHLAKKKITLVGNAGIQRNNLAKIGADEYSRFIGSLNVRYQASKKLNVSLGVTNFASVNRQVRIVDPSAPISLTELALTNFNLNLNSQYLIDEGQIISFALARVHNQTISTTDIVSEQANALTNGILSYHRNIEGITYSVQAYVNFFALKVFRQNQWGVQLMGARHLFDRKVRAQLGLSVTQNRQIESVVTKTGRLYRATLAMDWKMAATQNLGFRTLFFSNSGQNIESFMETRASLTYQLRLVSK